MAVSAVVAVELGNVPQNTEDMKKDLSPIGNRSFDLNFLRISRGSFL